CWRSQGWGMCGNDGEIANEPLTEHASVVGRVADSSSRNAVSFSSAHATKRFPSSRCASTIQIVRHSRSRAETQPKLQSPLLRLSAINSQYFIGVFRVR